MDLTNMKVITIFVTYSKYSSWKQRPKQAQNRHISKLQNAKIFDMLVMTAMSQCAAMCCNFVKSQNWSEYGTTKKFS